MRTYYVILALLIFCIGYSDANAAGYKIKNGWSKPIYMWVNKTWRDNPKTVLSAGAYESFETGDGPTSLSVSSSNALSPVRSVNTETAVKRTSIVRVNDKSMINKKPVYEISADGIGWKLALVGME